MRSIRGVPTDENSALLDSEYVLRRVHRDYYKPERPQPISKSAFKPSPQDFDGLSFFRASFCEAREIVKGQFDKYYVVQMPVSVILTVGATLVAKPDPAQPQGHCLLPEITTQNEKTPRSRELQQKLADVANKDGIIVLRPT